MKTSSNRGWKGRTAALLSLGLALGACAPPVTRTTTSPTTVGIVRLNEQWVPDRGVQSLQVKHDGTGYALHVRAMRVCRVWEAEQQFVHERWESKPNTAMVVGEVVMIGAGVVTTAAAWASTKDECGSDDLLSSCDEFAHGTALVGTGVALAGTTALAFDLLSADSGERTTSRLGRAIPPHHAPCERASFEGMLVRLVGPNVSLSSVFGEQGVARLNVPPQVWAGTDGTLDLDVLVDGRVIGRVVIHKEDACDGC